MTIAAEQQSNTGLNRLALSQVSLTLRGALEKLHGVAPRTPLDAWVVTEIEGIETDLLALVARAAAARGRVG